MRLLRLTAEVTITEAEFKKISKTGFIVWDKNTPVATLFNKPIKFVHACISPESYFNSSLKIIKI